VFKFLYKWLFCSWIHYKYRCYPTVWGPEQAKEWGIPYKPNYWHCHKCHPCNEEMKNSFQKFKWGDCD
jgi:hypothetical protein